MRGFRRSRPCMTNRSQSPSPKDRPARLGLFCQRTAAHTADHPGCTDHIHALPASCLSTNARSSAVPAFRLIACVSAGKAANSGVVWHVRKFKPSSSRQAPVPGNDPSTAASRTWTSIQARQQPSMHHEREPESKPKDRPARLGSCCQRTAAHTADHPGCANDIHDAPRRRCLRSWHLPPAISPPTPAVRCPGIQADSLCVSRQGRELGRRAGCAQILAIVFPAGPRAQARP